MATVLIIEDHPTNMKLAVTVLGSAGYRCLQAPTAEAGIHLARQQGPDLILIDVQLPGMDGLTATRLLKIDPVTKAIPVVALTAFAMKGDQDRIIAAGCDGYVAKPLDYRTFLATVATHLQERPREAVHGNHSDR